MLTQKVLKGSALLTVGQVSVRLIDFLSIIVTARLLLPEDFGLVALANTTLIVIGSVTNFPVLDALIRKESLDQNDIDTAFTLNLARSALVTLTILAAAHPIANIYSDERLVSILFVLSIAVFSQGLISPGMTFFVRDLDFKPQVILLLASKFTSVFLTIALAFYIRSYWAIIIGLVSVPLLTTIGSYFLKFYSPRFCLKSSKELFQFTGWITASNTLSTTNAYGDRFFIGSFAGSTMLGHYYQAGIVAITATANFVSPFSQVLFSAFSKLQGDHDRLGHALLRGQYALALVMFPLAIFLSAFSFQVVMLILGPNWGVTADFLVWLFPAEALLALSVPIHAVILASGRTSYLAAREFILLFVRLAPVVLVAYYLGLYEAVVTRALITPVIILINFCFVWRVIGLSLSAQLGILIRPSISALVLYLMLLSFKASFHPPDVSIWLAAYLGLALVLAVATYLALTLALWLVFGRPSGPENKIVEVMASKIRRWRGCEGLS